MGVDAIETDEPEVAMRSFLWPFSFSRPKRLHPSETWPPCPGYFTSRSAFLSKAVRTTSNCSADRKVFRCAAILVL